MTEKKRFQIDLNPQKSDVGVTEGGLYTTEKGLRRQKRRQAWTFARETISDIAVIGLSAAVCAEAAFAIVRVIDAADVESAYDQINKTSLNVAWKTLAATAVVCTFGRLMNYDTIVYEKRIHDEVREAKRLGLTKTKPDKGRDTEHARNLTMWVAGIAAGVCGVIAYGDYSAEKKLEQYKFENDITTSVILPEAPKQKIPANAYTVY